MSKKSFLRFFKRLLTETFLKFCSEKIRRDGWALNLADGKSAKSRVIFLTQKKTTKFRLAVQLSPLHCADRDQHLAGQRQAMHSECCRVHPNRFTFGGATAEHVNTLRARSKVNPIFS